MCLQLLWVNTMVPETKGVPFDPRRNSLSRDSRLATGPSSFRRAEP